MPKSPTYAQGDSYPHEGFVQKAVANHFAALSFEAIHRGHAHLFCVHPQTQTKWLIEVRGRTSAIGLHLRTGLGQLLSQMQSPPTAAHWPCLTSPSSGTSAERSGPRFVKPWDSTGYWSAKMARQEH